MVDHSHEWEHGVADYSGPSSGEMDPEVRIKLQRSGVPARFFHYFEATEVLALVEGLPGGDLVQFGFTRDRDLVCISPTDSSIWEIPEGSAGGRSLINSSLDAFLEIMASCERMILHQECGDEEELGEEYIECWSEVSRDLRALMAEVDPSALFDGSYWSDFLSDVENGDYG